MLNNLLTHERVVVNRCWVSSRHPNSRLLLSLELLATWHGLELHLFRVAGRSRWIRGLTEAIRGKWRSVIVSHDNDKVNTKCRVE